MSNSVLRFAPSPNGRLHLGHAYSALTAHAMARRLGAQFLLRIEDIDTGRSRPEFISGILEDLAWLGIEWQGPVLRQSEHFATYCAAAERLQAMGVLYPCFATRAEIDEASARLRSGFDPDGAPLYPGLHRGLTAEAIAEKKSRGVPFCLRLDMDKALALAGGELAFTEIGANGPAQRIAAHPERWGDVVIVRKDTPTSYHLSVVVDDARQGITHVTRGRDLFAATDVHRLLQVLLGLPEPVYHHHGLIADTSGRKLSKSAGDQSLKGLREAGWTAQRVRDALGFPAT